MSEEFDGEMWVLRHDDDALYQAQIVGGHVFMHTEIYNWSVSKFKEYKQCWKATLEEFADMGIEAVFVLIPDNDKKLLKFEKMFGLRETPTQPISGHILMYHLTSEV